MANDRDSLFDRTLSVSQVASMLVMMLVWATSLVQVKYTSFGPLSWGINFTIILNIGYYFISSWKVEESLVKELRDLRRPFHWVEIILRFIGLSILCSLTIPEIAGIGTMDLRSRFIPLLVFLYFVYLIWDLMVFLGTTGSYDTSMQSKVRHLLRQFAITDAIGLAAAIIMAVLAFLMTTKNPGSLEGEKIGMCGTIASFLFFLPVVWNKGYKDAGSFVKRLFNRERLR